MNIYNRLNVKTSNSPINGAYNITNFNESVDSQQILYTILSLKNINAANVDYYDWLNAHDLIRYTLDDPCLGNTHAVLSFWLDD